MSQPELRTIGRYAIQRVLASGTGRVVYEAVDTRLNRRVAVSVLDPSAFDADTARQQVKELRQKALACARLNHPGIEQALDSGEEGGLHYIAMEFLTGRDLKSALDAGETFSLADAVRITRELLEALQFAHDAGVVHRDVTAGNVVLTPEGRVKLCDFGIARAAGDDPETPGMMSGTPAYMSPEQITGGIIDRRTDVWAAGIVLYQLLTGEKPFAGAGAWTIAKKIIQDAFAPPSSLNAALPTAFDAVMQKALAKQPDARYASALEFAEALQAALDATGRAAPHAVARPVAVEPYAGEGPFIFASYKREDFERIAPLLQVIHDAGYRVWYDKGIPGSAEWAALLEERLKSCKLLLFFMSRESVESKYCRREIGYADSRNKPILSVRLEDAELKHGLDMTLSQYQMVDATAQGLTVEIERALKHQRIL